MALDVFLVVTFSVYLAVKTRKKNLFVDEGRVSKDKNDVRSTTVIASTINALRRDTLGTLSKESLLLELCCCCLI